MNVEQIAVERARAILDAAGVKYTLSLGGNGKQEAPVETSRTKGLSAKHGVNIVLRAMEVGDKTHFEVSSYEEGVILARTVSASGTQMHGRGAVRVSHRRDDSLRVYVERIK